MEAWANKEKSLEPSLGTPGEALEEDAVLPTSVDQGPGEAVELDAGAVLQSTSCLTKTL